MAGLAASIGRWLRRLIEAHPAFMGMDPDEQRFRPLTGKGHKDLSPIAHEKGLRIAYYLYETNPLAHRIVEITKDFVVGEGISFTAPDPQVFGVLGRFWRDPVNLWDLKQHNKALELSLYGEQCYRVFVNRVNGHVRLGYVDPLEIKEVVTDPDNCEVVREVVLKGIAGEKERRLTVVAVDEDPMSVSYGRLVGECFYFAINKVSNATRGRSDLLSLLDWIDAYDQFLFSRAERASLLNAFLWDVKLEGFNQEQIEAWLKGNPAPKPGSIRAHNEKVEWKAVSPTLNAQDASEEARLIKNHILGGAGLPEHWFAEGGNANRATAVEMGEPVIKRLAARQRYFKHMIEFIFRFVLDQALMAGTLNDRNRLEFSIVMPEISVRDMAKAASTLSQVTDALAVAERHGWIDAGQARKVFGAVSSHLGVGVEPVEQEEAGRLEEFDIKQEGLTPEKRAQRMEAAGRADKGLAIELYKGKGRLTKLYKTIFDRVITVDRDPATRPDFLMDNEEFIEERLSQFMEFDYVDFDAFGSPAPLIQRFFGKVQGLKKTPFVLALTDGALTAVRMRGSINLGRLYLTGEDRVTPATEGDYREFERIVTRFIKKVAEGSGFHAEEINSRRNRGGTALYAAYRVVPDAT